MIALLGLLVAVPPETVESERFSKALQLRALAATVRIVAPNTKTVGTGVVIRQSGPFLYVLTAGHVVRNADRLEVTHFPETSYPERTLIDLAARVVAHTNDVRDLALLRVRAGGKPPAALRLCPLADVPSGKLAVLVTGCFEAKAPTVRIDRVEATRKVRRPGEEGTAYFWQLSGKFPKGGSGGPLIDSKGRVLGICSGTNNDKGYFCHLEEIHRFLRQNAFLWLAEKDID